MNGTQACCEDPVGIYWPSCPNCPLYWFACLEHLPFVIAEMERRLDVRRYHGESGIGIDKLGSKRCFVCAAHVPNWTKPDHDCIEDAKRALARATEGELS